MGGIIKFSFLLLFLQLHHERVCWRTRFPAEELQRQTGKPDEGKANLSHHLTYLPLNRYFPAVVHIFSILHE